MEDHTAARINWALTIMCSVTMFLIGGMAGAYLMYSHNRDIIAAMPPAPAAPAVTAPVPKPVASTPLRIAATPVVAPVTNVEPPDPSPVREEPVPEIVAPRAPRTGTKTFSFMPGQTINVPNRFMRKIEIRSEYPLRVLTGKCHSDYTVEFFCEGEPGDVFISDVRRMPVFMTPRANSITITASEF